MNWSAKLLAVLCIPLVGACATSRLGDEKTAELVDRLVTDMTSSPKKQRLALQELERAGRVAIPYLVAHLDDTKRLAEESITLSNQSPEAFEGLRHYSPRTVHDALSALLNQMTGQSFVFVYNGATDADRERNLVAWRTWCLQEFAVKACGQ
ncbi:MULTISPECIES: hypothetical protein [Lysobacteraceae]|uniref:hypothetical protein n=1 Tax=Lysobacteraceae TaxID=32033 RepID=UPI001BCF07FA|nr:MULTISPECIES: hypothetical protein [Lysobacter]